MMTTSQYRSVPGSCRSSTGHGAARSNRQLGPPRKTRLPISPSSLGRNDLLSHSIAADRRAQTTSSNSHTAPAALKSP